MHLFRAFKKAFQDDHLTDVRSGFLCLHNFNGNIEMISLKGKLVLLLSVYFLASQITLTILCGGSI